MRYVFGDYSLDNQRYELRRSGTLIPLGPQVFNVLAYLMAHRDRVVSRNELFERLWPDQFVTDDALGRCIRAARRALEDPPEAPRYILTTRGRGYRFIAPVQEQPHALPDDSLATTVPSQSMPLQPSAAGSEALLQPVSLPTVSAERHRLAQECDPPSLLLAGEYKQVTVLCGGLSDAPALARRLGPEAMHRLMQTVFTVVQQVMQRYAGSLVEFSGDGFLALFGAPVAQEDHAQRAVLAALTLHEQLDVSAPDLRQVPEGPLAVCLGLHTGRVVVDRLGGDAQRLYTASGETTQVAMRLRQLAAPGTILLSAAMQHLVQEAVWVELQGEINVGESRAPVPVYCARGITQRRSGVIGHGARARSPFVGREWELALLHERLDAVVAGQGQVVAVVAEPGMGKSRLLAEYRHSLVGRQVRYAEGHCLSYGSATPYLPVVDLVRQVCGIIAGEPRDVITAKVQQRLQEADMATEESVPLLLHLLDIPVELERLAQLSPLERKARTFALLRQLFLHEAQQQPRIITVENLHWIDPISEEWLTSLVERMAGAVLLLLVTYRPGYRPPWLGQSYATQVALSPLRAGDSRMVVQAVLQTAAVPETVVQEILAKAAGNPFFLEELAWNVLEHGGQHTPLAVPETIEAVLAARIDRLPPEEKRLLQALQIIGMQIDVPLLQAMADLSEEELYTHLGHLQTAEFLYEMGKPPTSAYTFKHALTQEVAYGSLLRERRRALHARIVEVLETLYANRLVEQTERLAHHAWRGERWEKALTYFRQAGGKAMARSANREAVVCFEQAIETLQHLPETHDTVAQAIDLRLDLRNALHALGESARMFAILREAERLAETLDDHQRLAAISNHLSNYFVWMGAPDRAVEASQSALTHAMACGDVTSQVVIRFNLAWAYVTIGDYRQAIDLNRSIAAFVKDDVRSGRASGGGFMSVLCRNTLAWMLAECGAFAEGLAYGEEGIRLAETSEHPGSLARIYNGVGQLYLRKGDLPQAIAMLEQAWHFCQVAHIALFAPIIAGNLGSVYALSGRVAEALPLLEHAVAQAASMGHMGQQGYRLVQLSEGYLLAGRIEEASDLAARAQELARLHKEHGTQAYALHLRGEIATRCTSLEVEPVATHYRQALALAEELGMRPLQAHCRRGLGTLYAKTGQTAQAGAELAAAIALYRAMDMTFWLPPAEVVLAQVGG